MWSGGGSRRILGRLGGSIPDRPLSRRWRAALLLVTAATLARCSAQYLVEGRLAADDGMTGVECSVAVEDPDSPGLRYECGIPGSDYAVTFGPVPLGDRFRCKISSSVDDVFEVQVRCPGYTPLDVPLPVEPCPGRLFGACEDVDMGTLVVHRAPTYGRVAGRVAPNLFAHSGER